MFNINTPDLNTNRTIDDLLLTRKSNNGFSTKRSIENVINNDNSGDIILE